MTPWKPHHIIFPLMMTVDKGKWLNMYCRHWVYWSPSWAVMWSKASAKQKLLNFPSKAPCLFSVIVKLKLQNQNDSALTFTSTVLSPDTYDNPSYANHTQSPRRTLTCLRLMQINKWVNGKQTHLVTLKAGNTFQTSPSFICNALGLQLCFFSGNFFWRWR